MALGDFKGVVPTTFKLPKKLLIPEKLDGHCIHRNEFCTKIKI